MATVEPGGVGGALGREWAEQDHWKKMESLAQRKQVRRKVRIRTILGFSCANLGS